VRLLSPISLLLLLTAACAGPEPAAPPVPLTVKVASIQCPSRLGEVEWNRKRLTALVTEAAENGAKIVVLPEAAITGYLSQDLKRNWHLPGRPIEPRYDSVDPTPVAETVPGESTRHFAALARELSIYLTIPLVEVAGEGDDRRLYNTVCLASPKGEIVAHYRKLTPWRQPEQSWATPGDRGIQTCDTEYGRVGLAICYDIHTILDEYRPEKLWALLYPIAWVSFDHPDGWFEETLPFRLSKCDHHLIGANWSVETEQRWRGYGYTVIIARGGKVVARAKTRVGPEIVYATLPTATAR
jgi:predicted amidohydrolase